MGIPAYIKSLFLLAVFFLLGTVSHAQVVVKRYYDSCQVNLKEAFQIVSVTDSVRDGYYKGYYLEGPLRLQGTFSKGKKEGVFTEYYPSGKPLMVAPFVAGKKNGITKTYLPDGKLAQTANYVNGLMQDTVFAYYPDGSLKSKAYFKADKPEGIMEDYYPSGGIYHQIAYVNGKANGINKEYYPSGILHIDTKYNDGYLVEYYRTFWPNGKPEIESTIEGGKRNGTFKSYNTNGELVLQQSYKIGLLDGASKAFFQPANTLKQVSEYKTGFRVGKGIWYFNTGKTKQETVYSNTEKDQNTTLYHEDGSVAAQYQTANKRPVGTAKYYNSKGSIVISKISYADNGKQEGLSITKDSITGNIIAETPFENGKITGIEKLYYGTTGQLVNTYTWAQGIKTGFATTHNAAGKIIISGPYKNGKENGPFQYFDDAGQLTKTVIYKAGVVISTTLAKPTKK